jgi:hypothetical protein
MVMIYQIRIQGHLDPSWSAWFDGFTMTNDAHGTAVLTGQIVDQAALQGVLLNVRNVGLPLVAVNLCAPDEPYAGPAAGNAGEGIMA